MEYLYITLLVFFVLPRVSLQIQIIQSLHLASVVSIPLTRQSPSRRNPTMASYNLYKYLPSGAAAMIFLVGFAVGCAWHVIVRRRAWYFIPLIIGCLRTLSHTRHTTSHHH